MHGTGFVAEIEAALRTVQATLDDLTARGEDEAAFDLARAQYAASIRASWPGNLATLAGAIDRLLASPSLKLSPDERERLEHAAATFRRVQPA